MVTILAIVGVFLQPQQLEVLGRDCGVRVVRRGAEYIEEVLARDEAGQMRVVLVTPTQPGLALRSHEATPIKALDHGAHGLFDSPPSFQFNTAKQIGQGPGSILELRRHTGEFNIVKRIRVPANGPSVHCEIDVDLGREGKHIRYLLSSYAFAPDGRTMGQVGKPDDAFSPGLRPLAQNVIGDHFFRSPAVVVQKGELYASLVPDVEVLRDNRPMPTILDLDANNGVVDAPLLSYGFCDYKVTGHVVFSNDGLMTRRVPQNLKFAYDVLVGANSRPGAAVGRTAAFLWERDGSRYFTKVLPQVMPFENYAKVCYPAAFKEKHGDNQIGWFEHEIDGQVCGGIPAGWGYTSGWVSWQCWFNNLRSAWGIRWWGKLRGVRDYISKADKMLNLALAAPMHQGAVPTTYQSREKTWKGTLIAPRPECYYDLTNMAWKGIWLLRFLRDFDDCPRKEEIERQCRAMADCMVRFQNDDGSFPTWLTKDLKVVPVLDHSAQSSLPLWFLAEMVSLDETYRTAVAKCAEFLHREVIPGSYYYDFETFFSCSPKACHQVDGKVDHEVMRDPHTLQAPQNTLSMQWCAEGMRLASTILREPKYLEDAVRALDQMAMYQNTWPISFRGTAYTFGGFGVQNSDGEFLDARQAQFGVTMCEFGAMLGRKDLFERGVAAVRASEALINFPLVANNNVYPNPNYQLGLQPENCCHGGEDTQAGRTGFDWGEGSGLTAMAQLLHLFGGVYVDNVKRWAVGIDGVNADPTGSVITTPLWKMKEPYTGPQRVDVVTRGSKVRRSVMAEPELAIRTMFAELDGDQIKVVAVPAFTILSTEGVSLRGEIVTSGGQRFLAKLGPKGFEAKVPRQEITRGPMRLEATLNGRSIRCEPVHVLVDASFDFTDWRLAGWHMITTVPEIPTWSKRSNFGLNGGPFIGTCEDGRGGFEDRYTCHLTSPPFLLTAKSIRLKVGGGAGKNVFVELIDDTDATQLAVARGKNDERLDEVAWNVSEHRGKQVRIRIVDRETGPWGHINVAQIRCEP